MRFNGRLKHAEQVLEELAPGGPAGHGLQQIDTSTMTPEVRAEFDGLVAKVDAGGFHPHPLDALTNAELYRLAQIVELAGEVQADAATLVNQGGRDGA